MSSSDGSGLTSDNPVAVDNTMGVLMIGVLMAMGLWGASSVQVYYYYDKYVKDPKWIKILVALIWVLDTVHQGLITHSIYVYLVTHYANPAELQIVVPTLMIEVAISAMVLLLVQGFFLLRVWKLSKGNFYLVIPSGSLVLANVVCSLVYTVRSQQIGDTYTDLEQLFTLSKLVNIFGAAADVVVAVTLIYLLQSSRTGFQRSDTIINRLILFSLNTGLLTGIDAVMSLIMISLFPSNLIYIMFYVTNCKLYTNSIMATLNSRNALNGGLGDDNTDENDSKAQSFHGFRSRAVEVDSPSVRGGLANNPRAPHTLTIKVATETCRDDMMDDAKGGTPSGDSETEVYHYGKAS